ncbi:serine hydrolase [Streptomyces sp. NBC_01257]|nr:serine hydrolase [Streptomyces sp. NBC_01257]WRZ69910.1 serine hydrolase [Streptomyces sp. NBC_01257]
MAGESPDKSEQQKSSGTTRSEADPRLAVFREPASPEESGGSADTATAVFRTPRVEADPETGAETVEPAEAAESSESSEPSEPSESSVGAAVDSGSGADADAGADVDADGDGDGEAGPEAAADADEADAESVAEAESAEGGAESPEGPADASAAGSGAPEAIEEPEGAVEPVEGAGAAEAAESEKAAEPEEGDARLRAAVAAWVSKGGDESTEGDAEEPAPGAESEALAAESEAPDAEAAPDAETEADGDADEDSAAGAEAEAEAEADADSDSGADADEADAGGTTAEDAPQARVPRTREESGDEVREESGEESREEAEPAGDKRGIDQATAVFKAPKLPRVDQPTTALKITKPPATPESPAERTSKFVPLRADDVRPAPAPRAPEAPAPAPGAGFGRQPQQQSPQPPDASLSGAERTRQQPMPPRPPLDLLAELTNTPPPPETPVRTAVRRVKIWTPLVLLLLIAFAIVQMVRPLPDPVLTMTAESSYTFKGGDLKLSWPAQGQSAVTVDGVGSLGSAGAQKPAPIASVAKIMTAYVVLKEHPLTGKEQGDKITVDQQAEDESKLGDESTAPISKGQVFTEKQLLQLLMIPSGNNAARLFARWDSSETEFVAKMNAAAKDLGMTGTTYTDPSGLKKTTVSTATDQLKLARAVMQNEVLREIVDTPEIKIEGIDQTIYNNNTILLQPGVSGIKTGSSTPAGGNLVWSANTVVDGKKLWIYGAVMGQQAGTGQPYDSLVMSLNNSLALIKDAQKAVTSATVVKKGDVVGYVDDGFGGKTPLVATGDLKAKGWQGLKVELSVKDNGTEISRSMKAGTKVGVVTVGTGPGRVSAPVALQEDLKDPAFGQKLTRIS